MSLAWPFALLLLPLPWLLRRLRAPRLATSDSASRPIQPPPALADALDDVVRDDAWRLSLSRVLLAVAWVALVIAIAQPQAPGKTVVQPASGRALALVVDLSTSMERDDFTLDGVTSDRLSIVKRVAGDFIERRHGDRIALVLFGREAFVASAPTFDLSALRSVLDASGAGMAGRSTAIGDALGLALQTLRDDPASQRAIILLSDGTNNAGSVEPEAAATLAATLGVRIHTIAMASDTLTRGGLQTAVAADLDEDALAAIAERSGGRAFRARTSEELDDVYAEVDRLEGAEQNAPPRIIAQDWRFVPLLIALLALIGHALNGRHPR